MTDPNKDNVLIVHWHDLGRYLGVYGHPDVDSALAGHAQEQMPLTGSERREHLPRDLVGHRNGFVGQALGGGVRVRIAGDGARCKDDRGAPSLRALGDDPDHPRICGSRVFFDEPGALGVIEAQQVPAAS